MLGGYAGKILDVDLETGELKDKMPDEEILRRYIGGKGLGLKLIYDEFRDDMQPFDPDNLLVFSTGPATGARVPTSGVSMCLRVNLRLQGQSGAGTQEGNGDLT
ncbi:aldehyde ferredoxin oxidoreductase N-terminal domain-containing protein [Methanosarcina mazei]|uniref:aldehyde ferredoxin oxidoreductase N-terminal domain-containing protein n=1 Tax=Methanosarcina mazei TaxID=2209 RepID=UPI000AE9DD62|nr:aldehyde ferredoxin oxidoreductase N-terminal domain-containing protein [Methanosarcina mazei]